MKLVASIALIFLIFSMSLLAQKNAPRKFDRSAKNIEPVDRTTTGQM